MHVHACVCMCARVCVHMHMCPGSQLSAMSVCAWKWAEVGTDNFHESLRSLLGRGSQAGVGLRNKTSDFKGVVT